MYAKENETDAIILSFYESIAPKNAFRHYPKAFELIVLSIYVFVLFYKVFR